MKNTTSMESIKILLPYDGVSEEELSQVVSTIEGTEIEFDEEQNLSGELICGIITSAINLTALIITWKMLKVSIETLNESRLSKNNVIVLDKNGKIIKRNIPLKDVEDVLKAYYNESEK